MLLDPVSSSLFAAPNRRSTPKFDHLLFSALPSLTPALLFPMVAPVPAQSSKPPPPVLPNRGRPQDKDYPTSRPQPKDLLPRPQSSQNSALKFTIDKRQDLGYHFVCYLKQTRRLAPPLTPLDSALTRNVEFCTILVQISPLESALTDTPHASPLESALTKTPGVGG